MSEIFGSIISILDKLWGGFLAITFFAVVGIWKSSRWFQGVKEAKIQSQKNGELLNRLIKKVSSIEKEQRLRHTFEQEKKALESNIVFIKEDTDKKLDELKLLITQVKDGGR